MQTLLSPHSPSSYLVIGLMSGTSMDGIDSSILEISQDGKVIRERGHHFQRYSPIVRLLLKACEFTVRSFKGDFDQIDSNFTTKIFEFLQTILCPQTAHYVYNRFYDYLEGENLTYQAVETLSSKLHGLCIEHLLQNHNLRAEDILVIGYHGQTLYHNYLNQVSINMGDGQLLSQLSKIPVVAKFRENDLASGGKGAPFAPLYHLALAQVYDKLPLGIINCGGIANITLMPSSLEEEMLAFDTGPANGLLDAFVRVKTKGLYLFDQDGKFASQGRVCHDAINALWEKAIILEDGEVSFFELPPPKALDIGDLKLIDEILSLSIEDGCATLAYFTSLTIVDSLKWATFPVPRMWVLAGGGFKHPLIYKFFLELLEQQYPGPFTVINPEKEFNMKSDAIEANIFGYLAYRSLNNLPLSLPNTTGVPLPTTGGRVYSSFSSSNQSLFSSSNQVGSSGMPSIWA